MNEQAQRTRYAAMIESALPPIGPFVPGPEGPGMVQVERGGVLRLALGAQVTPADAGSYVDRLIASAPQAGGPFPDIVDRRGHRRPEYRGLLVYAWAQGCRLMADESGRVSAWKPALLAWCRRLEPDATLAESGDIPASAGATAASASWAALALYAGGCLFNNRKWQDGAARVFATLAAGQQPSGALLLAGRSDNPETHWYHELVMLHAAASYAAQSGDVAVTAAVNRAAEYHLAETQPDHATSQPWGLFAFVNHGQTRLMADEMLHNAKVRAAGAEADGVASILLADALYCQRR